MAWDSIREQIEIAAAASVLSAAMGAVMAAHDAKGRRIPCRQSAATIFISGSINGGAGFGVAAIVAHYWPESPLLILGGTTLAAYFLGWATPATIGVCRREARSRITQAVGAALDALAHDSRRRTTRDKQDEDSPNDRDDL